MKKFIRTFFICGMLLVLVITKVSCKKQQDSSQQENPLEQVIKLPTTSVELGGEKFTLEITFTEDQRRLGLAGRKELTADRGMIFVFDRPLVRSFWMKGCLIDLDIIFVKKDFTIAKITTMKKPSGTGPLKHYCSDEPIKYAIELPEGTAERLKLQKGMKVNLSQRIGKIIADPDRGGF